MVNLLLVTIVNPNLLNPGPVKSLSVYYQNVQGLIPISNLSDEHPSLNTTKIFEIHSYVYQNHPDIIIMNETWLKPSINDNEILNPNKYKVFRCDRSIKSHPPDPTNPKRFRRNGGGVLIGINSKLMITTNKIKLKCQAELLAVELVLEDGTKSIVCTCYRVGTLGSQNSLEIVSAIRTLMRKKKVRKVIVISDLNLKNVDWISGISSDSVEQIFVDEFADLGLLQAINAPTHNKGNILDILLTNSENNVNNIIVESDKIICSSDHFPILFDFQLKCRRKKSSKRRCYNFKRADWQGLNNDLLHFDWSQYVDCQESDIAWSNFSKILTHFVDKNIPKISIKSEFQPPWYDSECHELCRKKDRLHKKFKLSKSLKDELKFSKARKNFKNIIKSKLRDNLYPF